MVKDKDNDVTKDRVSTKEAFWRKLMNCAIMSWWENWHPTIVIRFKSFGIKYFLMYCIGVLPTLSNIWISTNIIFKLQEIEAQKWRILYCIFTSFNIHKHLRQSKLIYCNTPIISGIHRFKSISKIFPFIWTLYDNHQKLIEFC